MKRTLLVAALSFTALAAGAQTMSEALTYSQNNYYGTARTMALGNAVTALGGDVGSIGINPAGSAVSPYSQFTISPGVTISTASSGYSSWIDEDYGTNTLYKNSKMSLPNVGFIMNFDTYNDYGLLNWSFGFAANSTASYVSGFEASGYNNQTSLLGSFAAGAASYTPSELNDRNNYFNSSIPWNYLMAYQSGMISEIYDADGNYSYLGTTEGLFTLSDGTQTIKTLGELSQNSNVIKTGNKKDIVFNFGANFNNNLFLGVNIGLPVAEYRYSEYFDEAAVNPDEFEIPYADGTVVNFKKANYHYDQSTSLSGIYAKIGAIYLTDFGLRLGAAIQTPTIMTIEDSWYVNGTTRFTNALYDTSAGPSEPSVYSYNLRTPAIFNAGVAYTFWDRGLISFDFEMANYGTMRFSEVDAYGHGNKDYFWVENDVNKNFGTTAFQGRLGAEIRVTEGLSLRAGYTYQTAADCNRYDNEGYVYTANDYLNYFDDFDSGKYYLDGTQVKKDLVYSLSCGFGYSSKGSFFADFAVRGTSYPVSYFSPYYDYISSEGDYTPQVQTRARVVDAIMTLGWRF